MYTCPNGHLPKHLPEWTLARMDICSNGHLPEYHVPNCALARIDICLSVTNLIYNVAWLIKNNKNNNNKLSITKLGI